MTRTMLVVSLMILNLASCRSNNLDLSKVQWAPTIEDVVREPDVKLVVFLRDKGITPEGNLAPIEEWEEIGRIEEAEKIERIIEATWHCCRCEDDCVPLWSTWMGAINKKNQGLLINLGWQHWTKRVESRTHYSEQLYGILAEYGIIKPPKPCCKEFPKIDPNSEQVCLTVLTAPINRTAELTTELMTQNRWLRRNLDKCLEKLEAEKTLEPMPRKYGYTLRGDPNLAEKYPLSSEPFFVPYESPKIEPFLADKPTNIRMLIAMMNIRSAFVKQHISITDDWIENFEKRLQRIDPNQP